MLEREFQKKVIELAHMFGWKIAHFRTAINARGVHMTPVAADGKGWPDLVLVHPGRGVVLFRELKSDTGRLDPHQIAWGEWLLACGMDWGMWKPKDWDTIVGVLGGGRAT
jgi:hypothetical protein